MSLTGAYIGFSKTLVAVFPVVLLAWMRFGISAVAIPHWLKKPANEAPWSRQTKWLVFLESFLGNFLFSLCMLAGMALTTAVAAGVILASIPAVCALLSWAFLKEQPSKRTWWALALAVGGIALVTLSKPLEASAATDPWKAVLGNALLCAAVLCEAAYAVIGKKLTGVLSTKRITSLINLWGFALMTPFGLWAAMQFDFGRVQANIWLLFIFYALAASVGTVWLWMTGLRKVAASKAGVFMVMMPISSALVGVLFLNETLNGPQIAAFGLALLALVLATSHSK
jgi:drug/metabolite transporter (DMT)-like permease